MKKTIIVGGLAAIFAAGVAVAAPTNHAGRFDPDGNGSVSLGEMQQRMAERFQRLDADKNGLLTKAEFDAAREQRHERRGKRAQSADGEQRAGHHRGKRGGDFFGRMDRDGNGAVSLAEFTAPAAERVQRLDVNKDGQVSREEFAAARQGFRDHHRLND